MPEPLPKLTLGPLKTHKQRIAALMEIERYINMLFAKQLVQ